MRTMLGDLIDAVLVRIMGVSGRKGRHHPQSGNCPQPDLDDLVTRDIPRLIFKEVFQFLLKYLFLFHIRSLMRFAG